MEVYFTYITMNVPLFNGQGIFESYENKFRLHLKIKIRKCVSGEILNKQF